jgi:pantoate--beta-alanine ligase
VIIFNTVESIKKWLFEEKSKGKSIGFVPTMGALHKGHMSLVEVSTKENNITVCSIFVNPTQFDDIADLEEYPRTKKDDYSLLERNHCSVVFAPSVKEIYTDNFVQKKYTFNGLEDLMEGEFRSGHFNGVANVVKRLFEIVEPTKAYFGEKDFQQLLIVREMVSQEQLSVVIKGIPIFREVNGLAMSSRNRRLSEGFGEKASLIYKALRYTQASFHTHTVSEIKAKVVSMFDESDLALQYFIICDNKKLNKIEHKEQSKEYRAFIAAYAGEIRLIDNLKI